MLEVCTLGCATATVVNAVTDASAPGAVRTYDEPLKFLATGQPSSEAVISAPYYVVV
jgi:hypothetical protein